MTRKQSLQKQATELGIEFKKTATVAELESAIAEQESRVFDKPEEYVQERQEEEVEAAVFNGPEEVRVYTRARHGDQFVELAQEFCRNPKRQSFTVVVR